MQGSGLIGPDCAPSHGFQRKSHLKSESCESCVSSVPKTSKKQPSQRVSMQQKRESGPVNRRAEIITN